MTPWLFPEGRLMVTKIVFFSAVLIASPAWGQATADSENSAAMLTPPPISEVGLSTAVGAEERSNYVGGSLVLSGGYIHNLYPDTGSRTVNDSLFLIQPAVTTDHASTRSHETFAYSSSFSYYFPNNALNAINQSGSVAFQYRLSPHMNLLAGDTVTKTSDTWSQPASSDSVSGGLPSATPGIIVPFAPQLSNSAYAQLGWQLSLNDMVGGEGNTSLVSFSNNPGAQGLYDSNSRSGSGFYTHRLTDKQYIGATYQYSEIVATPKKTSGIAQANLDANNMLGFYTVYLTPTLSLSLGGGGQHYELNQAPLAPVKGWAPAGVGSLGWQGLHTAFALSYSRLVTEGAGILGIYSSNSATVSGRWQMSRNWTGNLGGNYSNLGSVAQSLAGSVPGGHTLSGSASLGRRLGEVFSVAIQYQRLHQTYPGIPAISNDPDSSRESASITYYFSRPLGR